MNVNIGECLEVYGDVLLGIQKNCTYLCEKVAI